MNRALVVGLGVTGQAVARQLAKRGTEVVVLDDRPTDESRRVAATLGVEYVSGVDVKALVAAADLVSPSPGVAVDHPVIEAAVHAGVPVWSEFELAARWDDRPMLGVTGTNGKTTVTWLVERMLQHAGVNAIAAGNTEVPLVDALDDPAVAVFVVEASSFRLQFIDRFRAAVAVWLNLTPDHLDWHPTVEHYADAKFRLWETQRADDLAIGNVEDAVVMTYLARAQARRCTFGIATGDWRVDDGALVGPAGIGSFVAVDELPRALPHDLANALAATATAIGGGASVESCAEVLRAFEGFPHRVQLVRDAGGVRWFDDSKATTPMSVVAAVSGFASVVLIAGGRNKGLDLGVLRSVAGRVRHVVAIGEAAPLVAAAFDGVAPVVEAATMDDAVRAAAAAAHPGDAVLLSPGCASYDWYRNYGERGDDFARAVGELP